MSSESTDQLPSFLDVVHAMNRIRGVAHETPVFTSRSLNELVSSEVFFKCENFQRGGAFKFRGALNAITLLGDEERARGVITHSSGNHAQAVSLAAKLLGVKAVIVMPKTAPKVKVAATRGYGAEVHFSEPSQVAREELTRELIEENGYVFIHPYDNVNVIAGAGTVGYEFFHQVPNLDVVLAPVGGGGLISGTGISLKHLNPDIIVKAVEPELADDAYRSLQAGTPQKNETYSTIADGLRMSVSTRTLRALKTYTDGVIKVSEEEIAQATRLIIERMKILVEPSGATPFAALLQDHEFKGKRIGIILSGGNMDLQYPFHEYLG